MDWIYKHNKDNSSRYILGTKGEKPLICFGVNPSTAEPGKLDSTMKSVERIARNNGYDSFIMLNLYPQRATDPNDMDVLRNNIEHLENIRYIQEVLGENVAIWAAWGTLIEKRSYLCSCLEEIVEASERYNCKWVTFGKRSKAGHPHHPLYLAKDSVAEEFDVLEYLEKILLDS